MKNLNTNQIRWRTLLLATTACCCLLGAPIAFGAHTITTSTTIITTTTPTPAVQITTTSPSVISSLLREQLTRREQPIVTTSGPLAAIETKVPSTTTQQASTSTSPAAAVIQVSAASSTSQKQSQQQQSASVPQFQHLTPVTLAATTSHVANIDQKFVTTEPVLAVTTTTATVSSATTSSPITTTTTTTATTTTSTLPPQTPACQHNNQTYQVGAKWNDDCLQVCECILTPASLTLDQLNEPQQRPQQTLPAPKVAISACVPRCPIYKDPPGDNCKLQRSKSDECCLEWQCELEGKFAPTSPVSPTSQLITSTQTERGQLNMSTTEIRMPASISTSTIAPLSSQTAPPATVISTAPTTTTTTTTTSVQQSVTNKLRPSTTTPSSPPTITTIQAANTQRKPNGSSNTNVNRAPITTTTPTTNGTGNQQKPATTTNVPPSTNGARRPSIQQQAPQATNVTARNPKQVAGAAGSRTRSSLFSAGQPPALDYSEMIRSRPFDFPVSSIDSTTTSSTPSTTTTTTTEQPIDETLVDPEEHHLCIVTPDQGWKVNATWQVEPCNQVCRCVFSSEPRDPTRDVSYYPTRNLKNESMPTEIRCGLPEKCAQLSSQLIATPSCPEPRIRLPQLMAPQSDSCVCPEISCDANMPTISAATRQQQIVPVNAQATRQSNLANSCKWRNGKWLGLNETFNDECHSICRCSPDGEIRCEQFSCPSEPPTDLGCVDWQLEPNFRPNSSENKCCAEFVCKTSNSSSSSTSTLTSTSTSSPTLELASSSQSLPSSESPASESAKQKSCLLLGKELPHGQRVPEEMQPRSTLANLRMVDPCDKVCTCQDGKIVCEPACPALSELPPDELECPAALAYQVSDECCPRWTCQIKENYALQDFQVNLVNRSSVEILVALPQFAIGQSGRLELNFTSVPVETNSMKVLANEEANDANISANDEPLPPSNAIWQRRTSIKTFDGVFSSKQIKYYWSDLKPNHRYWFKVLVRFDNADGPPFDEPMESGLQTIVMPSNSATSADDSHSSTTVSSLAKSSAVTTTTTTTTTITPPTRILQPALANKVQPIQTHRVPTQPQQPTVTQTSSTTTTTTTTSSTPQNNLVSSSPSTINLNGEQTNILKPNVAAASDKVDVAPPTTTQPCNQTPTTSRPASSTAASSSSTSTTTTTTTLSPFDSNRIDDLNSLRADLDSSFATPLSSWAEQLQQQVNNAPIQRYAWHLLFAFMTMAILFVIVSYSYWKKVRVIAPITSPHHNGGFFNAHHHHHNHHQSAYDNPTFTKLKSYYVNPPHVLLVDANNQNLDNMAKQKNYELDKASPLNKNKNNHNNNNNNNSINLNNINTNSSTDNLTTPVHHQNGRQHLI